MRVPSVDSDTLQPYRKTAGDAPLPGYVLLEPLGRGGFGEVWKCEAPGGLLKAIKFVPGGSSSGDSVTSNQFQQEFEAFLQIKTIRHPFLLTLERVEQVDGDLVMVMELADRQMRDRYEECRGEELPGIPRNELISYMAEAAEALDVINSDHGLQHLDVKPANLFITAGHVKVGDYGLVCRLDGKGAAGAAGGLTPKYVAPEVLRGTVDARSDQYSLALVYQEMLTGTFPYAGRTPQQIMMAHVSATPDVSPLPESDRAAVARALAKKPDDRFESCLSFVQSLIAGNLAGPPRSGAALLFRQRSIEMTPGPSERTGRHSIGSGTVPFARREPPNSVGQPPSSRSMPALVSAGRTPPPSSPLSFHGAPPEPDLPLAESEVVQHIRISPIRSLIPIGRLRGEGIGEAPITARDFSSALVTEAAAGNFVPVMPGDIGRQPDGSYVCRFPSTVPDAFAPLKLGTVRDQWAMTMESEAGRLVFRKAAGGGGLWSALSGKKAGLELTLKLPPAGKPIGEVAIHGTLYGAPDRAFLQASQTALPKMIEAMRLEIGNVADRRRAPRITASYRMIVHPLHSDGRVEPPVVGQCRDVSTGGVAFTVPAPLKVRYAYVEFSGALSAAGLAILVKLIRSESIAPGGEHLYGGPFRLDL